MKISSLILAPCSLALLISGCTTTAPTTKLTQVSRTEAKKSGVIVPLHFITVASLGKNGCDLSVRQPSGLNALKTIHVQLGTSVSFAELEPGLYFFRELRCGTDSADLSTNKLPPFEVFAGRMSVIRPMEIRLSNLQLAVRVSPISDNLINTVYRELNIPDKSQHVVSAYTGKALIHE